MLSTKHLLNTNLGQFSICFVSLFSCVYLFGWFFPLIFPRIIFCPFFVLSFAAHKLQSKLSQWPVKSKLWASNSECFFSWWFFRSNIFVFCFKRYLHTKLSKFSSYNFHVRCNPGYKNSHLNATKRVNYTSITVERRTRPFGGLDFVCEVTTAYHIRLVRGFRVKQKRVILLLVIYLSRFCFFTVKTSGVLSS